MKGAVFTYLQDFVEETHGLAAWDDAIEQCNLPSEGLYVSTQYYDVNELYQLVTHFSNKLHVSPNALVRTFGRYIFPKLFQSLGQERYENATLFQFLKDVDKIIHVEVKKLNPEVGLPQFRYESGDTSLTMVYRSERQLCYLAEGLIMGAAEQFKQKITITHPKCMHDGHEECHLVVELV